MRRKTSMIAYSVLEMIMTTGNEIKDKYVREF